MSVLFLLVPLALLLGAGAVAGFVWAVNHGEFDDMETPAWRVITQDDGSHGLGDEHTEV